MSRAAARVESTEESAAGGADSSDDELPGHSNMWCPLLEVAYHSIGAFLAMNTCHSSKATLSQSCHVALFVNLVARSSTDEFFTLCDVHLEHERTSQAACLQRRHEKLSAAEGWFCALWQVSFPFSAHTAGGTSCREVTTCL